MIWQVLSVKSLTSRQLSTDFDSDALTGVVICIILQVVLVPAKNINVCVFKHYFKLQ